MAAFAEFVSGWLINFVIAWVAMLLLPMRRPLAFFVVFNLVTAVLTTVQASMAAFFSLINLVINYCGVPVLFWRGALGRRVMCGLLLTALVAVDETLSMLVFSLVGIPQYRADTLSPEFLTALRVPYAAFLVAGGFGLQYLLARVGFGVRGRAGQAFVAFAALELAMVLAPFFLLFYYAESGRAPLYVFTGVILFALAALVAVLFSAERFNRAERERARSRELEDDLRAYLERSRAALLASGQVARFRHDQRNHLQVVASLIERGELDEARAYVHELTDALRAEEQAQEGSR